MSLPQCSPVQILHKQILANWPLEKWKDHRLVVAVSGGPDSVALLRSLVALHPQPQERILVAHFNHGLRAQESEGDEIFVRQLAESLHVPLRVGRWEKVPRTGEGESLEGLARRARYHFLLQSANEFGARYVATGHTADDQAETVFHRIVRGTSLRGLAGIPRLRPLSDAVVLVRPLLPVRRQLVLQYLQALGQDYRTDSSNLSAYWTRNKIRLELLPKIAAEINPHVVDALLRLANSAREAYEMIHTQVLDLFEKVVVCTEESVTVQADQLANRPGFLIRELLAEIWRQNHWPLRQMSADKWQQLEQLVRYASQQTAKMAAKRATFPGVIVAETHPAALVIKRHSVAT